MTVSQPPQLVRLPDGRRLAFADYGPRDGVACIVLSGMPGSRLAPAWAFPEALLVERGVRLLGVDRPGYGRSDPNPQTTALSVAEDVGVLCTAVGLERVAVPGISVGAPFALACVVRWPQRVGSMLLSSPMGPWEWPETRAGITIVCTPPPEPVVGVVVGGHGALTGRLGGRPGVNHRSDGLRDRSDGSSLTVTGLVALLPGCELLLGEGAVAADRFDVVVVGAGPAGCVLANRLTQEGDRSVCVLEAGPDYGPDPAG